MKMPVQMYRWRGLTRILKQPEPYGGYLAIVISVVLAGCGGGGGSAAGSLPVRGAVAGIVPTFSISQSAAQVILQQGELSQSYTAQQTVGTGPPTPVTISGLSANSGVDFYNLLYYSIGPQGQSTLLSGVLAVPQNPSGPVALLSYQHATHVRRSDAPSQNPADEEMLITAAAYAANGYAVAYADYLGLGVSSVIQPFLIDSLTVPGCIDMIKAAQSALATLKISTNGQLFISGYSQGGHNALAVAHELQVHPQSGLTVSATAALSGPYNLDSVDFLALVNQPDVSHDATVVLTFVIFANNTYETAPTSLGEAILSPWPPQIPTLFDGSQSQSEIFQDFFGCTDCAPLPSQVVDASFLQTVLNDPTNSFAVALNENQQWNWAPHPPTEIGWSASDDLVPPTQSQQAFNFMAQSGAPVTAVTFTGFTHAEAIVPTTVSARHFLDQFRK